LLLVVDNCEHQLDACAGVVDAIMRHCPGVTVLATGRERLGAAGEHVWLLSPLEVPDPTEDARRNPAVMLFVERARAARPDFQITERNAALVVQVCRGLDGLPLALELAAARLGALTLDDVASRLGDRLDLLSRGQRAVEARHRSLRGVVEWSYDLLSDPERLLFQRLSVFAGGFTVDQAEAVCADRRVPARRIVTLLASLVDRSMVVRRSGHGRGRYALLETLRVYAQERLHEHGDHAAVQHAHARQFVAFAEAAATGLAGHDEAAWFAQTEAEIGNLRVAHEWAVDRGDSDTALRISAALHRFGFWRMRYELLGDVAMFDGRSRDADDLYGASARRYRAAGNVQSEVWAPASQALSCSYAGLADEAAARVTETTTVASGSPNPTTQALALYTEGECLLDQDPDRALAQHRPLDAAMDHITQPGRPVRAPR
jgi:predicted ATPase